MRYLTALFAMFFLILLDVLIMIGSLFLLFVPVIIMIEDNKFPLSWKFAKGVWLDS